MVRGPWFVGIRSRYEVGDAVASVCHSGSADRGAALLAAARQCAGLQGVGAVLALARIFGPRGRGMQLSG